MDGSEIVQVIELFVGLLGIAALVAILAQRIRVPDTVALVLVGLGIGLLGKGAGLATGIVVTPQLVLLVLLPGLVFDAAYRLRVVELRRWATALLLLAIPGVLVTAGVVALVLSTFVGLPLEIAFIAGAMVSATDPVAVVATFKRLPVARSLATMVDSEALLNDGTGLAVFTIAVSALSTPVGPAEATLTFVTTLSLSTAIGLGLGYIATRLMGIVDDRMIELTISVVVAYGAYLVADAVHQSGVIATVMAGVVVGNLGPGRAFSQRTGEAIDTVWEFIAYLLTAVAFLLIGLVISPDAILADIMPIAWAVLAVLVARLILVYGLVGGISRLRGVPGVAGPVPRAWLDLLFWAGLRGAVAVAMALALPAAVPQRELLQAIVFGVVLFTLLVQATTISRLVPRAQRDGPAVAVRRRAGRPSPLGARLPDVDALEDAEPDRQADQ
jgi:CPA1 family monovalent cation:H+ antiporter